MLQIFSLSAYWVVCNKYCGRMSGFRRRQKEQITPVRTIKMIFDVLLCSDPTI